MAANRKDEVLKILEEQAKSKRENKFKSFQPYAKQMEFCNATADHSEVVLQAGNQLGKSEIGSYMTTAFLTGVYPDWWKGRRFDRPTRGWACGESTVAVRDVSQRKLCGPPGDDSAFGTGMIPKSLIIGKILGHGAGGAFDTIKVKHISGGTSELSFKSYDQDRSKWQGATLDFGWCDEEPPTEHYYELLARLVATNGLAFSTFTPLSGFNLILPRFRERTPEAIKDRIVVRMRMQDAKHLENEDRRKALIATFPEHQRRARIDGLPMLGSGAVFEDVTLDNLLVPLRIAGRDIIHSELGPLQTSHWAKLWAIDFGIDHPFAAVLLAWDRDNDVTYVLSEVKIKGGVPAIHASRMKSIAANVRVAWPHDGTQRDKGSGEQLANIYKREGLLMMSQHATLSTGGYSTEAGIMEMLTRMRSDKFKVSTGCLEWQEEFMGYHRKEGLIVKTNDDLLSATRVGVMQIRSAKPGILGPILSKSKNGQIAIGVDSEHYGC
jgi:phage terminase large subunit-like protein